MDKDGKLNEPEFIIAMWLIYGKLKGMEIPDSISESLKSEVGIASTALAVTPSPVPPKKLTGNYDINLEDLAAPAPQPEVVATPPPTATPTPPTQAPVTSNPSFGPDGTIFSTTLILILNRWIWFICNIYSL